MRILPGVVGTRSVLKGTSELRAAAAAAINSRGAFFLPDHLHSAEGNFSPCNYGDLSRTKGG